MSRHSSSSAYDFRCHTVGGFSGCYRISWVVDFYYPTSRLRFPRRMKRDTDEAGARKFCKKHGIDFPASH